VLQSAVKSDRFSIFIMLKTSLLSIHTAASHEQLN
jgi:hypothetical protein